MRSWFIPKLMVLLTPLVLNNELRAESRPLDRRCAWIVLSAFSLSAGILGYSLGRTHQNREAIKNDHEKVSQKPEEGLELLSISAAWSEYVKSLDALKASPEDFVSAEWNEDSMKLARSIFESFSALEATLEQPFESQDLSSKVLVSQLRFNLSRERPFIESLEEKLAVGSILLNLQKLLASRDEIDSLLGEVEDAMKDFEGSEADRIKIELSLDALKRERADIQKSIDEWKTSGDP